MCASYYCYSCQHNQAMKFYTALLLATALVLLLQLDSVNCKKKKKGSHSHSESSEPSDTDTTTDDDLMVTLAPVTTEPATTSTTTVDLVAVINFILSAIFDTSTGLLFTIGSCAEACNTTLAECADCYALNLPPPPVIPDDLFISMSTVESSR